MEKEKNGGSKPSTPPESRRHQPPGQNESSATYKDEPKLKLTKEGWVLSWKGKELTIFDDILGLRQQTIKEAFDLPSGIEGWKVKNIALENWWPESFNEFRNLFSSVVGEDGNVTLMGLALLTMKLRNPEERIWGVLIEGSNSAGKSNFVKAFLGAFRSLGIVEEFTRVTSAFFERQQNVDRKILYLQEAASTPSPIHISMSEGLVRVGLVDRDESGRLKPTEILVIGTPFLVATTTAWRGNPDLIHRIIRITLDESPQQTFRIAEFKAKLEVDHQYKLAFERFVKGCQKILGKLWEAIPEDIDVIIPFFDIVVEKLRQELGDNVDVKLRRDITKLSAFIKASAILSMNKRPKFKTGTPEDGPTMVVVATPEDLEAVLPLLRTAFKATIAGVSEREMKVLKALEELEASKEEGPAFATYRELARVTGIPSSTIRLIVIPKLEQLGLVIVDRESRPHMIERTKRPIAEVALNFSEEEKKLMKTKVREAIERLLSQGYATTQEEIRLEIGKTEEIEAGERVVTPTTQGEGVISEKERGEGVSQNSSKSKAGEAETERASFGIVAIPIMAASQRLGRLLIAPLDFQIEFEKRVAQLLGEDRWRKLVEDLRSLYGDAVRVEGDKIHVDKNIAGEEVTILIERLKDILETALKEREPQEHRETEEREEHKPKTKTIRTKIAFLCEECFQAKKREGKVLEDRGKPSGLSVCEICCKNLAEHVVVLIEEEEGGEGNE